MIVVEDVPQFADSDAERPLKELFQAINRSDHFLIGDADMRQLGERVRLHRRLQGRAARASRSSPTRSTATRCSRCRSRRWQRYDFPEGRGIFVENGRAVTVQMPLVAG